MGVEGADVRAQLIKPAARERAHMPYGDIGIKVWIYKGQVFKK